jgi:hypothetical protein
MLSGATTLVIMAGMLLLPSCASNEPQAGPTITPTILATEETPSPQETPTGEVWEGPVTGHSNQPGCSPSRTPVTGDLEIVVGDEGTVTGSVTERRGGFSCQGGPTSHFEQTYQISGQKTAEAFELLINGSPATLPIRGTHATFTLYQPGAGGFDAEITFTVDCKTCE